MTKPNPENRHHPSSTSSDTRHQGYSKRKTKLLAPTKSETALLPKFQGLSLHQIHTPTTREECQLAVDEILAAGTAGFDTEAKPTFRKGEKSDGPHVVQFALSDKAFIFLLNQAECEKATADLISSPSLLKVGFGLKNDHSQIRRRFGIDFNHVLDLDKIFRDLGYPGQIGVRSAMGLMLKQCFKKSKSTTTSNWALPQLTPRQLLYAGNDAYAALVIMQALQAKGQLD